MNKQAVNNSVYDLTSVRLPVLSGFVLRLLVRLMESPFAGLIQNSLLEKAGITAFRKRVVDTLPTFIPSFDTRAGEGTDEPATIEFPAAARQEKTAGFRFNSITDYARAYREGIITPAEVAERFLQSAGESDKGSRPLRAFIALDREDMMRQAEASVKRFKEGKPLGLLDGVPVTIKDQFSVRGYPATVGTRFMGTSPAAADAAPVARLREAGAVIAGKTNMHELGLGVTGLNPSHGTARNPYNPGHHTGGSSSGSATAVSAGFGPVSLGADGGGSIRIPSSFCGLVGLMPTFGRVSLAGDSQLCWSVEHVGPLAATAADAAILYRTIAGRDAGDPFTFSQPPVSLNGIDGDDIRGLTIGIYPDYFHHAETETVSLCETLLKALEGLGARVKEITLPGLEAGRVAHSITIAAEISQSIAKYHRQHAGHYGLDVRLNLAMARRFTSHDFLLAQRVRSRLISTFEKAFSEVDVIITPTTGIPAPAVPENRLPEGHSDLSTLYEIMRFTTPANMTGLPAISFPAGYTKAGLPVGMHVTARAWQEPRLLQLAAIAEGLVEKQKPQVYYDLLA